MFHPRRHCRSGGTGAHVWVTVTFVLRPLSKPPCPGAARCGTRSFNGLVEWPSILFLCRDLSVDWGNQVGDTNVWLGGGIGGDVGACCVSGGAHKGVLIYFPQMLTLGGCLVCFLLCCETGGE